MTNKGEETQTVFIVAGEVNHPPYVVILGTFDSFEEANLSIKSNVRLLMNGIKSLSIYEIPLEKFVVKRFHGNEPELESAKEQVKKQDVMMEMLSDIDVEGDSRNLVSLSDIISQEVNSLSKRSTGTQLSAVVEMSSVPSERKDEQRRDKQRKDEQIKEQRNDEQEVISETIAPTENVPTENISATTAKKESREEPPREIKKEPINRWHFRRW